MRLQKKHVVGMLILSLIIPTVAFFPKTKDSTTVLATVYLEVCMGISLFVLRNDYLPKKIFYLGLAIAILTGVILIVVFATFPYWIIFVMGWR